LEKKKKKIMRILGKLFEKKNYVEKKNFLCFGKKKIIYAGID